MNWLTPYIEAWEHQFGGHPATGPLAKTMKQLEARNSSEDVLARWEAYLREAGPMFANAPRFAQTYGSWKPKQELKELRIEEEG